MISFLLLPVLTFVGADKNGVENSASERTNNVVFSPWDLMDIDNSRRTSHTKHSRSKQTILREMRVLNGSKLLMECLPAEYLVRTHMAPDFESPQLVRKLDWFHEGALIASFQQDIVTGISEEWWVASTRHELRRPFYQLRVAPILASDSGVYKCVLETDPLFTLDQSTMSVSLLVIVKPPTPSKPFVSATNQDYVPSARLDQKRLGGGGGFAFVNWNHSVGAAHRPILRYSILISRLDDSANIRVLTTENNRTSKIVNDLLPNVQYSFSVRAENAAGESDFGAETILTIKASVPRSSPKIISIRNQTSSDSNGACIEIEWSFDDLLNYHFNEAIGYRIMATELLSSSSTSELHKMSHRAREWHVKRAKTRANALLCSLEFGSEFQLKIEADTGFGVSPSAVTVFRTMESIPSGPPESITIRASEAGTLSLSWEKPGKPNGRITSYQIYLSEKSRSSDPMLIRLLVGPEDDSKIFTYNITNIVPNVFYEAQLSASTQMGEGKKSNPFVIQGDQVVVQPPKILQISYECSSSAVGQSSVLIEWTGLVKAVNFRKNLNKSVKAEHKDYFYKVQFEENRRKFSLNATKNFIKIDNLESNLRYSVTVTTFFHSSVDGLFFHETAPSNPEIFKIDEANCNLQSSICSSKNANCKAIVLKASGDGAKHDFVSIFLVLLGVLSTTFLSVVFTIFLKRHCAVFKIFLSSKNKSELKKLQKSNGMFRRESLSLINDSLLLDVSEATFGRTVAALEFDNYCDDLSVNQNEGFQRQFQELNEEVTLSAASPPPSALSADDASLPRTAAIALTIDSARNNEEDLQFANKNRYVNVLAAEHSRIRINRNSGSSYIESATGHDASNVDDGYINANYVDSCDEKKIYIATQAPLPHTFADFWAMIWQEKCNVIVMVTNLVENGKRKCDQYWPSTPQVPLRLGLKDGVVDFEVTLNAQHVNAIFIHRIFMLTRSSAENSPMESTLKIGAMERKRLASTTKRIVHQFQFTSWPDHGVPSTVFPLLHFLNCVVECHSSCQIADQNAKTSKLNAGKSHKEISPIVVHCSAGVGRSGSFILIDSMRRHLLRCDRINIQAHLRRMRRQRARLVQTLEQFIFCHKVLQNLIRHGVTRQPVDGFSSYLHFLLSEFLPPSQKADNRLRPRSRSHMQRQFEEICRCNHEPNCQRGGEANTNKCVSLPGYYRTDEFIVANWSSECTELWSLIWRRRCPLILLFGSDAEVGDFFHATNSATVNSGAAAWQLLVDNFNVSQEDKEVVNERTQNEKETSQIMSISLNMSDSLLKNEGLSPSKDLSAWPLSNRKSTHVLYSSSIPSEEENERIIRLKMDDLMFDVKILMMRPSALDSDVWAEIERIQDQLLQCSEIFAENGNSYCTQQSMLMLDPRSINSSMPFILCALQSAACQMEAEGFIDVLLYLSWYKHVACGCWSAQSNIEYIYAKLMELIHLKEVHQV